MAKSLSKKMRKEPSVVATRTDYSVLLNPIITEKSSVIGASGRTVVFHVDPRATKTEVKAAVERIYKVNVEGVRTLNMKGKVKRSARSIGQRADKKKAYVTLREGQTINLVEGL